MIRRIFVVAATLSVVGFVVGPAATPPASAQEPPTTLYVGTAAAPDYAAPVLVVLDQGTSFDSFAVTLSFDPSLAALAGVDLAPDWVANGSVVAPEAGTIELTGEGASCAGGGNCLLATLRFRPLETGDTPITIATATLSNVGTPIDVAKSAGQVSSVVGAPEPAPGGGAAPSTQSNNDSLFAVSFIPAVVFVIALATSAAIGSVLVIAVGRRAWRWSTRPAPVDQSAESNSPVTAAFEGGVGEFLSRVEAFGRVTGGEVRDAGAASLAIAASAAAADGRDTGQAGLAAPERSLPGGPS